MTQDVRGLTLYGADSDNAARYNTIVQDYFDYRASAFPALKELCKDAPDLAMAHLLKGYLLLSMGTHGTIPAVQAIHDHVILHIESLSPRERLHAQALSAWCQGNTEKACDLWDQALMIAPLDLLALKLQHFSLFWMGHPNRMRDACARVAPYWNDDTPGWSYVQGMLAFAMQETGEYAQAEHLGREAYERHPDDLWALHAVAHVYEMQGKLDEGTRWLDKPLDAFDDRNPFRGHLWWHAALFALEKGNTDRVFELYDQAVRPAESTFYLDIQNSVSLLTRLEFAGIEVGDRWQELADIAEQRQGDHVLMFTEPHCAMALARTQRFDQLQAQLDSLRAFANTEGDTGSALVTPLVAPLCEAIGDYYRDKHEDATAKLMAIRYDTQPIGGSHAQRDVFALYLIDAAIKAEQLVLASSLLAERVARHHNSLASWQRYQSVCNDLGNKDLQHRAQEQIERLQSAT